MELKKNFTGKTNSLTWTAERGGGVRYGAQFDGGPHTFLILFLERSRRRECIAILHCILQKEEEEREMVVHW